MSEARILTSRSTAKMENAVLVLFYGYKRRTQSSSRACRISCRRYEIPIEPGVKDKISPTNQLTISLYEFVVAVTKTYLFGVSGMGTALSPHLNAKGNTPGPP